MDMILEISVGLLAAIGAVASVLFVLNALETVKNNLNELSSLQWDARQSSRELRNLQFEVASLCDRVTALEKEAQKDGQG